MDKDSIEIRLKDIEEKISWINLKTFREPIIRKYVSSVKDSVNKIRKNMNNLNKILERTNYILESTEDIRDYCITHDRSVVDDCNLAIKAYAWQIVGILEN